MFLRSESQTCLNANEKEPAERKKCKIRDEGVEKQLNEVSRSWKGKGSEASGPLLLPIVTREGRRKG